MHTFTMTATSFSAGSVSGHTFTMGATAQEVGRKFTVAAVLGAAMATGLDTDR